MPAASATPSLDGPTQASRVKGFAAFFKSYMSVWSLVVAALPIPVGAFKLIPTFESQRSYLSVYTSLFCFLSLGFIFLNATGWAVTCLQVLVSGRDPTCLF